MMNDADLAELRRRLSPALLRLRGVSGVGTPGGKLTVYLAEDSDDVRRDVGGVVANEAPGVDVSYVVTGAFRPH